MAKHRGIDLARIAYEAYGASTGWLTFDGRPMPSFDRLGGSTTTAWIAAVSAVERVLTTPTMQAGVADVPATSGRSEGDFRGGVALADPTP